MNILIVIAKEGFRDEEYLVPKKHFESLGYNVTTSSTEKGLCTGKLGASATADISFSEVDMKDFDTLFIVGGPGSYNLVGNPELESIIKSARDKDKLVTAICYAPVILAKAGALSGLNATVWNKDEKQEPILKECNVHYVDEPVVVDTLTVTGNGPLAAQEFAEQVVKMMS